ncbi:MAG: ABC transporter ATP-binding protein [Planctomycetota bacterium]|jgi:ABC-type multidrug transport system ATPase subunit
MEPSAAIEINDLTVRFDGRNVLDKFAMRVAPGEKVHLQAASGAGKSTLLQCILGFVAPQAGEIRIEGELLTGHSAWKLRRHLAYVPQEPMMGAGSVAEVFERPFHYHANAHLKANLARIDELMDRFLLSPALLRKDVTEISGGEKQRVALISAILLDRSIMLLDEPTSALDKASKQAVADYMHSSEGMAILFAAHDAEALGGADRAVVLPKTSAPEDSK